jgi:Ras-related protein Rab-2A
VRTYIAEVGKSSLMLQLVERRFQPEHEMTFGVECASYMLHVGDQPIELEIWDTVSAGREIEARRCLWLTPFSDVCVVSFSVCKQAGQEAYMSITRSYYRNADGCVLVYDITRKETFQNLPRWLREAEENTNNPQLVTILVGNKADLTDRRQVSTQEAAEFAAANGLMFMEVSVRTAFGDVEEVFRRATRRIVELQSQDNDDEDYSGHGAGGGSDSEPASPVPEPARTSGNAGAGTGRRVSPTPSPAPSVRPARLTNQNRCVALNPI